MTDAVYGPGHRGGSKADGPRLPTLPVGVIENRDAAYPTAFPLDVLKLAFRVLVEAAHPDVADALTVQGVLLNPICQEEIYNP